jgi:hypothetical protein
VAVLPQSTPPLHTPAPAVLVLVPVSLGRTLPHSPLLQHPHPSARKSATTMYSLGQKFWQTMHVTQNCHQAEYPSAYWPAVLHAFMGAQHSHAHVT